MFQRKAAVFFGIIGIGIILGFISGVAPGYFLKGYALFGIGAGFFFFMFLLLIIIPLIYEYLNRKSVVLTSLKHIRIFHKSLSRNEKVILSFTNCALFFVGALFGIICELLFKAISASTAAHLVIAAFFIIILLIALVIILIIELKQFQNFKQHHYEQHPVIIESNQRTQLLTKSQDGPTNTASRANRYRWDRFNDVSKSSLQDSSTNSSITNSTNTFVNSKQPSTIQSDYQRLLHPSSRFYINEKVYDNDNDIAQIIEVDGSDNYRIQYLHNGLIDYKTGAELRKALPLIK